MSATKKMKLEPGSVLYPVLPQELIEDTPLIEAYIVGIKDSTKTSVIIQSLNKLLPVAELAHLKRVRAKEILLCPKNNNLEKPILELLSSKGFDVSLLENEIKIIKVAKIKPQTRKQYEDVQKLWPCNFHSDKYLEKLCTNTLFDDGELLRHMKYMNICITIAANGDSNKIGCVIVDPKIDSVVAIGFDESNTHPCKHAVMLAIDNVANTQNGGAYYHQSCNETNHTLCGIPKRIYKELNSTYEDTNFGAASYKSKEVDSDGPYLCTNYYVYVTREPCIMCAMALIHSRAKRVFYGSRNPNGGLGSLCKIHTVKDLNHHYEAFGGLLEEQCSALTI